MILAIIKVWLLDKGLAIHFIKTAWVKHYNTLELLNENLFLWFIGK